MKIQKLQEHRYYQAWWQQQSIKMAFQAEASFERLVIGPHTLFAEYPPKIEEAEIKPVNESGEIVLSRVVIPGIYRGS